MGPIYVLLPGQTDLPTQGFGPFCPGLLVGAQMGQPRFKVPIPSPDLAHTTKISNKWLFLEGTQMSVCFKIFTMYS